MAGPEVMRMFTPISAAMMPASVVLPRPGGPCSRTWSSASERRRAASMKIERFSFAFSCPMYSAQRVRAQGAHVRCPPGGGTWRRAALPHRNRLPIINAQCCSLLIPYHFLQRLPDDLLQRQCLHVDALERRGDLRRTVARAPPAPPTPRRALFAPPAAMTGTASARRRTPLCSLASLSFSSRMMRWAIFLPMPGAGGQRLLVPRHDGQGEIARASWTDRIGQRGLRARRRRRR